MQNGRHTRDTTKNDCSAFDRFARFDEAGLANMMGMNVAWMEALSEMGAEVSDFVV